MWLELSKDEKYISENDCKEIKAVKPNWRHFEQPVEAMARRTEVVPWLLPLASLVSILNGDELNVDGPYSRIIKPRAVGRGLTGEILHAFTKLDFRSWQSNRCDSLEKKPRLLCGAPRTWVLW